MAKRVPAKRKTRPPSPRAARSKASVARTPTHEPPTPQSRLAELEAEALRRGVKPATSLEDFRADFWPEDETADEPEAPTRHQLGRKLAQGTH